MGLRKHQREMQQVVNNIIAGAPTKEILLAATPGGGKSSIPIMAGKLIEAGLADKIAWVVPRSELQDQGERGFLDPFFRDLLGHRLTIRSSTNDRDPSRGLAGWVTTYQALGVDHHGRCCEDFERYRYVLCIDEYHHVEVDSAWEAALQDLIDRCAFLVKMSGTLERGNGSRIAFTDYREVRPEEFQPHLQSSDRTAVIEYTRQDALAEQAILPLHFFLSDGPVAWQEKSGRIKDAHSLKTVNKVDASKALYTALNTGFADDLLKKTVRHWQELRYARNPRAKLLVVTADFADAKKRLQTLQGMGVRAAIATSHSPKQASANIQKFKGADLDALVTIAMAYEGMDVPEVTHIAALKRIRSQPWLEQMFARAVRVDKLAGPYGGQRAYVFAPHDKQLDEVVKKIREEQAPFVVEKEERPKGKGKDEEEFGEFEGEELEDKGPVKPLSGQVTGEKEVRLGHGAVPMEQLSLFGDAPIPLRPPLEEPVHAVPVEPHFSLETPREQERRLRKEIDRHIGDYAFRNHYEKGKLNKELKNQFGKARADMTLVELENLQVFIRRVYPIYGSSPVPAPGFSRPRGSGRRVSNKVVPFNP